MTDAALVLRARGGDHAATDTLVRRHEGFAGALAAEYFVMGGDSEDVRAEALHGLAKAIRDWRPGRGAAFVHFAYCCMRRQVQASIRAADRKKHRPLTSALRLDGPVVDTADEESIGLAERIADPASPEPHEVLERRAEVATVVRTVRRLSESERRAVVGIASGRTYREVAGDLDCTPKAVDNAAQRGRRKVAMALEAAA
jgi:RNA polymerase sporulation-specific sigma factor